MCVTVRPSYLLPALKKDFKQISCSISHRGRKTNRVVAPLKEEFLCFYCSNSCCLDSLKLSMQLLLFSLFLVKTVSSKSYLVKTKDGKTNLVFGNLKASKGFLREHTARAELPGNPKDYTDRAQEHHDGK